MSDQNSSQDPTAPTTQPQGDDLGPDVAEFVYGTNPAAVNFRAKVLHRAKGNLKDADDGNRFMNFVAPMAKQMGMSPREFIIRHSMDDQGAAPGAQATQKEGGGFGDMLGRVGKAAYDAGDYVQEGAREIGRSIAEPVADIVDWPQEWRAWNPPQNSKTRRVNQ